MRVAAFFLVFAVTVSLNGADQNDPLTKDELLEIHEKIASLNAYRDNEFIHEEKLSEALTEAHRFKDRPVRIVVEVMRVTKEVVHVESFLQPPRRPDSFPQGFGPQQNSPQLAFLESPDMAVRFSTARARTPGLPQGVLGQTLSLSSGDMLLKVGDFVPLELAKSLRKGDRLELSGKLADVSAERSLVAAFIIVDPKVRKFNEDDN